MAIAPLISRIRVPRSWPAEKLWWVLALTSWTLSLVTYMLVLNNNGLTHVPGIVFLLLGSLTVLLGFLPPIANLAFLWALLRLWKGKGALLPATLAALFALLIVTPFHTIFVLDANLVWAYGPGLLLWLIAHGLMLTAAGVRDEREHARRGRLLRNAGLAICALTVVLALTGALIDRRYANTSERRRLQGLLIKNGPVCRVELAAPQSLAHKGNAALEIVFTEGTRAFEPFDNAHRLLGWGLTRIRKQGRDYTLHNYDLEVKSTRAEGEVDARLELRRTATGIDARLLELPGERVLFQQHWDVESLVDGAPQRYCPDFESRPDAGDQPRTMLLRAMNIPDSAAINMPFERSGGYIFDHPEDFPTDPELDGH